ncbi:MAG: Rne/Rng family ribonuclease [Deltaproteobacteria bacterium]|nr:Rne/Rng family ribonuclease [Deltaproteobacteria bacterium]
MKSAMLINAKHHEETRVAIVEEEVLQELEVEYSSKELLKGNVYKGVITKIQPSIHAIFVDFGGSKHGFLPFSEVHPSLYGRDSYVEGESKSPKPTIEKVMKAGQSLTIQVVKDERDSKGAYLTTYLSIAGRYLVLMPGSKKGGVSRKIEDEKERTKLKEILSQLKLPEDMSVIIRTAGMGRSKPDLKRDLNNLLKMWNIIKGKAKSTKAPSSIYRESDLVLRSIRDYFTTDVKEVLIDNLDAYKKAKDFMKIMMPRSQSKVKLYQENIPLFSRFNLEAQIESIYNNRVPLKSGGSIVIDPTEALVSIDVNSGKSKSEKNIEDTAFKTNMEAAAEVARQLRLRDLGGLIVIDFIDMKQKKHIIEVEKTLKTDLKRDKARISLNRISKFGLLEMSRQRIKSSLIERSFVDCPHCGGSGTIKSIESNAVYLLRKIHESAAGRNVEKVDILLPSEVANYLQNRKRQELLKIEKDCKIKIEITGQSGIPVNSYNLEISRKEVPAEPEKEAPVKMEEAGKKESKPRKRPRPRRRPTSLKKREKPAGEEEKAATSNPESSAAGKEEENKGLIGRIRSVIKGE